MKAITHNGRVQSIPVNGRQREVPALPVLQLVESSRTARRIAQVLVVLLLVTVCAMVFVPWQQTVTGSGQVVAFSPLERPQPVKAPLDGRVRQWADGIREGVYVEKGDLVLELQDNDPLLRERMDLNVRLLDEKIDATEEKVVQYEGYVEDFREARLSTIASARELIEEAQKNLEAKQQDLEAAKANELQKRLNAERQLALFEGSEDAVGGLTSKYKVEVAQREHKEAVSKLEAAKSYVAGAEAKLRSKQADLDKYDQEAQAKVAAAEADLRTARADLASYKKERTDLNVKQSQLQQFEIRAPSHGYVLNLAAFSGGEYVKKGDSLFTLVPETTQLAVEVRFNGNDAPLLEPGRHVRLQFEGWPAVQFSGWPSVAVGTFGGELAIVDATDDGKNRFRAVVVPEEHHDWPDPPYLRQGVRTNAWVLLDQVPLGYEVWRRLNGFPPTVAMDKASGKPAKPPMPKR